METTDQTATVPSSESEEPRSETKRSGADSPPPHPSQVSESVAVTSASDPRERRVKRSTHALTLLATLAVLFTIYFARAILMPIVMAVALALLFRPVVRRFRRYHIPDTVSAGIALFFAVLVFGSGTTYLVGPAKQWINDAPAHLHEAAEKLKVVREQLKEINRATEKVQDIASGETETPRDPSPSSANGVAAEELATDQTAQENVRDRSSLASPSRGDGHQSIDSIDALTKEPHQDTAAQQARPIPSSIITPGADETLITRERNADQPMPVEIRQPRLTTGLALVSTTGGVLAEVVVTFVLAYFLLSSGDMLINNVLHILPTYRDKRSAVELVYSVERGISSYLLIVTCINIALGGAIGVAMWWLGMPNPILWGAMATLFNFIPFLGAMVGTSVVALVAVLAFDSLAYAAVIPVVYFGLTALEGNFITPQLLGRSMSLNPIMVFLSLTFWGWMWGIGGAVLAVPILAALKVGFDQFDRTRPIGTLLGGDSVP